MFAKGQIMQPHKLTNVVVLLTAMMLAGVASIGLGLSLRFSMVTGSLLVMCCVVGTGLAGALVLYRQGMAAPRTEQAVTRQETH
jgi:hypothetical protein